jgi:hypothetical protein
MHWKQDRAPSDSLEDNLQAMCQDGVSLGILVHEFPIRSGSR